MGGGAQAAFLVSLTLLHDYQCVILQCDFVGSFIEIMKVFIIKLIISILTTKSHCIVPELSSDTVMV